MSRMPVQRGCSSYDQSSWSYYDLIKTKSHLEKLREEEPKVAAHFKAWRDHREVTIETVDSLQKRIDSVCVGCNVVRGVGAAAEIVGVFAGIVGAFLEVNKHESAEDFKQVGKYCAGAGAVAVASSNLLEAGLTQSAINEIKRVLKKDVELTTPLRNWAQFSHEVDNLSKQLFQCDIASDTFANVMKVAGHCVELLNAGDRNVRDLLSSLQSCKMQGIEDLTFEVAQKVTHFVRQIYRNPKLLEPLGEICEIFKETPYTYEFLKSGVAIYSNTFELLSSGPLPMLLSAAGLTFPGFSSALQRYALDAVTIASKTVTIILAAKNVMEGQSKYSEALNRIKFELRLELSEVSEQISDRVRHLDYEDIIELRSLRFSS